MKARQSPNWRKRLGAALLPFGLALAVARPMAASMNDNPFALEVANRIGILEHCRNLGFASRADIAFARKVLKTNPDLPPAAHLYAAQSEGRRGQVLAAGERIALRQLAADSHQTLRQMCQGVAASARAGAVMAQKPH